MDCILMENCRLCQSKPGIFPFILDEEFIQKTMECTKITLDDDLNSLLPNFICDDCKMKILEFSEYINEVKRIDENLRRIASSYTQMDSPSKNDAEMESEHKCNKCPATFSDTETYDIHLKSHSTVSKFECTVCSKTFNRECNFELHMKNHLELYCSMCDSTFTNGAEKEVHICAVHVKKEEIEDDSDKAKAVIENLLPPKSKPLYEREYGKFCGWRKSRNVKGVSEELLLSYFTEKLIKCKVSTLWSCYSMLKSTLMIEENVDISKFMSLKAFLKRQYSKYEPVKSNVLEREQVHKFLKEAPDNIYLMVKVALFMGIAGGCRMDELHKMKIDDIEDRDDVLIIQVVETKTNKKRKFTIMDNKENTGGSKIELYRKYVALRPENTPTRSFFLAYRNEKCIKQVVGINTFYKMPRMIAEFLKLPSPDRYTGHCFRRSSATLLADAGADTVMVAGRVLML